MAKQCCKETWDKIPDDEPAFIIRGRDQLAPATVLHWLEAARDAGVNPEKFNEAYEHLTEIAEFQEKHLERCKLPD
jgi:hypothetical protein